MHVAGGPTYKPWLKLGIISHTLTACQKKLGTFEHAFTAGKVPSFSSLSSSYYCFDKSWHA